MISLLTTAAAAGGRGNIFFKIKMGGISFEKTQQQKNHPSFDFNSIFPRLSYTSSLQWQSF